MKINIGGNENKKWRNQKKVEETKINRWRKQ
jgi:hypothetical protein